MSPTVNATRLHTRNMLVSLSRNQAIRPFIQQGIWPAHPIQGGKELSDSGRAQSPYCAAFLALSLHHIHDVADDKTAVQLHLQPSLEHEEQCDAHSEAQGKRHCPARFRLEP